MILDKITYPDGAIGFSATASKTLAELRAYKGATVEPVELPKGRGPMAAFLNSLVCECDCGPEKTAEK